MPELRAQKIAAMILHPIPLPDTSQTRFVLGLQTQRPRQWKQHEKNLLAQAARAIGLAFESALERERIEVLLSLHRQITQAAPETAYQAILEAAVHTVPGVEAGSLLLRQGESFAFKATVGFDLAAVQELRFGEDQQEQWCGLSSQEWKQGLPRILSPQIDRVTERSRQNSDSEKMNLGGLVADIQANLCLPIPYRGEVLALLNLDNLHDPAAFGQDSLQAAQIFSSVVGSLLHELRYRALLEESALSDSLTGLGNRRAFDHKLQEELARASRYGYPLSLLMMDLQGFKRINDYLGHAKGDEALIQVALALKSQRRNGDSLYRWGGDEFAAILPHADRSGAIATANRYAKAIKEIDIESLGLGINVGASSFPEEAKGYDQLLGVADDRMYQAKAQGVPLLED